VELHHERLVDERAVARAQRLDLLDAFKWSAIDRWPTEYEVEKKCAAAAVSCAPRPPQQQTVELQQQSRAPAGLCISPSLRIVSRQPTRRLARLFCLHLAVAARVSAVNQPDVPRACRVCSGEQR
jgi:hypothetical protein